MALDHSAKSQQRTARTLFALEQMVNDAASRITAAEASIATNTANIATNTTSIATLVGTIANLSLNDLADVIVDTPADGQTLIYSSGSGKWENTTPSGGSTPEVEVGSGPPSGQPATTLFYYDQVGKRFYARNDATEGSGAEWEYWDATGVYTEP